MAVACTASSGEPGMVSRVAVWHGVAMRTKSGALGWAGAWGEAPETALYNTCLVTYWCYTAWMLDSLQPLVSRGHRLFNAYTRAGAPADDQL